MLAELCLVIYCFLQADIENDKSLGSIQLEFFDFEKVIQFPSNEEIDTYLRVMNDRKVEVPLEASTFEVKFFIIIQCLIFCC